MSELKLSELKYGYSPILNPLDLEFEAPFELIPDHFLQRASPSQIPEIQREFFGVVGREAFLVEPIYQSKFVEQGNEGRWEPMPREKWRYNVLSYKSPTGQSLCLRDIELASNVSEVPLDMPISFLSEGGTLGHRGRASNFFLDAPSIQSRSVTREDLADVRVAYAEFQAVRKEYPEIERALDLFESLKLFPRHSGFRLLGLFSIIELLITHNPKLEDVGDSITHQMKGKMKLLANRFNRPIDYSCFGEMTEENVWAKLYSLRSVVAHGGELNFQSGTLSSLKSLETATVFLSSAVRALMRHSFQEPLLYRDLKAC